MNFPPGTINTKFEIDIIGISYLSQCLFFLIGTTVVNSIILFYQLRQITRYQKLLFSNTSLKKNISAEKLTSIRKKCFNLPYIAYVCQIFIPIIVIWIISIVIRYPTNIPFNFHLVLMSKFTLIILSNSILVGTISFIFLKGIYTGILKNIFVDNNVSGLRIDLKRKILMQIFPMVLSAVFLSSIFGYSRLVKEKGDMFYHVFKSSLNETFNKTYPYTGMREIEKKFDGMDSMGFTKFIISPDNKVHTLDGTHFNKFFSKYLKELSPSYGNRIYDFYGTDIQGVYIILNSIEGNYMVGVKYNIVLPDAIRFFSTVFLGLLCLTVFILLYFAKSLSNDIKIVTQSLIKISDYENPNLEKSLSVTSNDELGDLIIAFNKVLEKEKENLQILSRNNEILMEKEKLASLGQLIGGIAHNLKTPIMSISGGLEALKELIDEYKDSIYNSDVTKKDHEEISDEMMEWVKKIHPYCAYMSDVISAVKGQAVYMNSTSDEDFTIDELIKRVDVLMKFELKKTGCKMFIFDSTPTNTKILGDVNNIVQVLNNLISNAIDAYEGAQGKIDVEITKENEFIKIAIRDYAKGMSPEVGSNIFKQMITTKGKNGTGLGLYMAYSTIKGKFNGDMKFISEEGKGTTFFLYILFAK